MAISEIFTTATYDSDGVQSIAWPSGMTAGTPAAMLVAPGSDGKPTAVVPSTWTLKATKSDGTKLYVNVSPTASEIASPIPVTGRFVMLRAFPNAAGFGKVGTGESLTLTTDGAALSLWGWKSTSDTLTVSNKTDTTDVANESYVYGGESRKYNTWFTVLAVAGVAYIDTNAGTFFALEVLPQTVPNAPTLISPIGGVFLDYNAPFTFVWKHNSPTGGKQRAAEIRYRTSVTWHYVVSRLTESTTETVLTALHDQFFEVNIGPAPVGTMEWQVKTFEDDAGTIGGDWSASGFFTLRNKPTLTASVSGSGLAHTVSWTPTITNGVQTWYRVRVTLAAEASPDDAVYDTGAVAGEDVSLDLPADFDWVNGTDYKAWVEVGQTGGQQTVPVTTSSFTVSWTPPTAPTITVQSTAQPLRVTANALTGDHHRVRLSFTAAGVAHTITKDAAVGAVSFDVPLAPYGTPTSYTIRASQLVSGVELWSDADSQVAVCGDRSHYLVSVDLTSWRKVLMRTASNPAGTEGITVSYGIGASVATVVRTPSAGMTGTEVLLVETQADMEDLCDPVTGWLSLNSTFWLRRTPERSDDGYADKRALKVARTTAVAEGERIDNSPIQYRTLTFSWVQQ